MYKLVIAVVTATAILSFAGSAGANGRYADKTGDSGSAQDIAGAEASSDAAGQLTFRISIPNMRDDGALGVFIDSDANPATGNAPAGGVRLLLHPRAGGAFVRLRPLDGLGLELRHSLLDRPRRPRVERSDDLRQPVGAVEHEPAQLLGDDARR